MKQLSMFDEVPDKVTRARKPKAETVDMFAGENLTGGGVVKMECKSQTRETLVLSRPGETDEQRLAREARERTPRLF